MLKIKKRIKVKELTNFRPFRVDFVSSKHHIVGRVVHYEDGLVLTASTREPGVHAQLERFFPFFHYFLWEMELKLQN
jgi:hypothetical protein